MTDHTPGPWRIRDRDDTWEIYSPGHDEIEAPWGVCDLTYTGGNSEANARLIAAAPAMLAALADAEDFIERTLEHGTIDADSRVDLTESMKRVHAAIAAASKELAHTKKQK